MQKLNFNRICSVSVLVLLIFLTISNDAAAQREISSRRIARITRSVNEQFSVSDVVKVVDDNYGDLFIQSNPLGTFELTKDSINAHLSTIPESVIHKTQSEYLTQFYDACDRQNLEDAVSTAFKYLMIGGETDEQVVWKFLIDNYAVDGDTDNTKFLLNCFSKASVMQDNAYHEIIENLRTEYDDVLNPINFADAAKGYWVSMNKEYAVPNYFLHIHEPRISAGTTMLQSPTLKWKVGKHKGFWYRKSQNENEKIMLSTSQATFCNVDQKLIRFVFGTEKMHEGHTDLAHGLLEGNREMKAEMHGEIWSSDGNFGEKLAGSVATELVGGLLDAFAMSLASSSKTAEGYQIELNGITPTEMTGNVSYRRVKLSSSGKTSVEEDKTDYNVNFVKWEPDDSVIFICDGKPMFIGSIHKNDPLLKEYKEVRKKYNFWKPQYLLPSIIAIGGGGYCIYRAIDVLAGEWKKDTEDSFKTKALLRYLGWFMGGAAIITVGLSLPIEHIAKKRLKAYREINERSMSKLKSKGVRLTLQPEYTPLNNALGVNMCINF